MINQDPHNYVHRSNNDSQWSVRK